MLLVAVTAAAYLGNQVRVSRRAERQRAEHGGAAAEGAGSRDEVPVRQRLDTTEAAGTELTSAAAAVASVRDNRSGAKL